MTKVLLVSFEKPHSQLCDREALCPFSSVSSGASRGAIFIIPGADRDCGRHRVAEGDVVVTSRRHSKVDGAGRAAHFGSPRLGCSAQRPVPLEKSTVWSGGNFAHQILHTSLLGGALRKPRGARRHYCVLQDAISLGDGGGATKTLLRSRVATGAERVKSSGRAFHFY